MKNTVISFGHRGMVFFCAIILAAVGGLAFVACDNGSTDTNNNSGGGGGAAVTFGTVTYDVSMGNCSAAFTYTGSDTPTAKMLFATDTNKATANPMEWSWNGDTSEDMTIASGTATLTGDMYTKAKYTTYANVYVVIEVGSGLDAKQYWHQLKPAAPSGGGDGVTITPATATVAKGATRQFTASESFVNWSIVETGKHASTNINFSGLLTVNIAEPLTTLTIRATTMDDPPLTGTATVTLSGGAGPAPSSPTWTDISAANNTFDNTKDINGIAWGGGRFVAVGGNSTFSSSHVAHSTDGLSWTKVTVNPPFTGSNAVNCVAWGNDRFVAGGSSGAIAYSTDGMAWTQVSTGSSASIYSIAYGGPEGGRKFVAVGASGKIVYSSNGTAGSWSVVDTSQFGSSIIYGVAWGGGSANKFVAVGDCGKMAYSSDGTTWQPASNNPFGTAWTDTVYGIAWGNGKFIAVGTDNKMAYSSDGMSWTPVTGPFTSTGLTDSIHSITYGGPSGSQKFVAGSYKGRIAVSSDGTTWSMTANTPFNTLLDNQVYSIVWGGSASAEKFIAVGGQGIMAYWNGQ